VEWSKKGGRGFHWGSPIKHSTHNLTFNLHSPIEREPNGLLEINIVCTDQQLNQSSSSPLLKRLGVFYFNNECFF
jgi:hypothetical protein